MTQFQTCNQQLPPDALLLQKSLTIFSSKSYILPSSARPKIPGQKRKNRASGSRVHTHKDGPHQPSALVHRHWYLTTCCPVVMVIPVFLLAEQVNAFSAQTQAGTSSEMLKYFQQSNDSTCLQARVSITTNQNFVGGSICEEKPFIWLFVGSKKKVTLHLTLRYNKMNSTLVH